jgi:hypothetical protein
MLVLGLAAGNNKQILALRKRVSEQDRALQVKPGCSVKKEEKEEEEEEEEEEGGGGGGGGVVARVIAASIKC